MFQFANKSTESRESKRGREEKTNTFRKMYPSFFKKMTLNHTDTEHKRMGTLHIALPGIHTSLLGHNEVMSYPYVKPDC